MITKPDSKSVEIRKAARGDMPNCARILNDWMDECDWHPRSFSREEIAQNYAQNVFGKRHMMVATKGEKLIGYSALADHTVLTALYLDSNNRGEGIGKILLKQAEQDAKSDLEIWPYELNVAACRFYERNGYHLLERDEGSGDGGLTEVRYGKVGR